MNTPINDGGPAFPHSVQHLHSSYATPVHGMSLRDWFAGQALTGLLANWIAGSPPTVLISTQDAAQWAMQFADAMLTARNQQPEKP